MDDNDAPPISIEALTRWVFGCLDNGGLPTPAGETMTKLLPARLIFLYEMY